MIQLYHGDCRKFLFNEIEENSIDLTVTSPPYDNLRTYNNSSTWGCAEFCGIASGLWRVTKPGGVVVWVVGDATIKGSETGSSFEQALTFRKMGFNLHDTMIYQTNKPPMNDNRYQAETEYMFVFSKGTPATFNAIMVPSLHPNVRHTGGHRTKDGEKTVHERKHARTAKDKVKGNVWYLPRSSKSGDVFSRKHPATFPEQLANDHIVSWSNLGDTILDPFMGSGTTGKMALLNNRHFIGCEIDSEYFQIAKERIEAAKPKTEEIETA